MLKKKKFLIGGVLVIGAIAILGYTSFMNSSSYFYTVSEFLEKPSPSGELVRLNGIVTDGSLEQQTAQSIRFKLADAVDSDRDIPVVYTGVVPDTFKAGGEAVVEGRLNSSGIFEATTLMPKCASKYASQ